jgi:hypothetical protein
MFVAGSAQILTARVRVVKSSSGLISDRGPALAATTHHAAGGPGARGSREFGPLNPDVERRVVPARVAATGAQRKWLDETAAAPVTRDRPPPRAA